MKTTKCAKNWRVKGRQKRLCWLSFGTNRESSSKNTLKQDGWIRHCTKKPFASSGEKFRINREACSVITLYFFTIMQSCILQTLHKTYCQLSTGMFSHICHINLTSLCLISTSFHIWMLHLVVSTSLVLPQWKMHAFFQNQAAPFYSTGLSKLITWYNKCLDIVGDYVEK